MPNLRIPIEEKFWSKVNKNGPIIKPELGPCWMWEAASILGYGYFHIYRGEKRYQAKAHRVSYELVKGPIPNGMTLDHLCRNKLCVNPDHLEPVTMRENTLRGIGPSARNAQKTHCPKGHPLTEENLSPHFLKRGWRICWECEKERAHFYNVLKWVRIKGNPKEHEKIKKALLAWSNKKRNTDQKLDNTEKL